MGFYKKNKLFMWFFRLRDLMFGFILLFIIKMFRKSVDGLNIKVKKGNFYIIC